MCGRELPSPIEASSENIRIKFVSDNEINGDGFTVRILKEILIRIV
jgi:hypothetical protein